MEIKIVEIRFLNNGERSLKAFCDIEIGGWIIREWRVIKDNGKRPWIAPPQLSWKEPGSGRIQYKTIVTLPDEIKGEIDRIILNRFFTEEMERESGRTNHQHLQG